MLKAFKKLVGDDHIVKEFDLSKPDSIFQETVESIASTIDKKLNSEIPRRYIILYFNIKNFVFMKLI
jgi:hypothetical protein